MTPPEGAEVNVIVGGTIYPSPAFETVMIPTAPVVAIPTPIDTLPPFPSTGVIEMLGATVYPKPGSVILISCKDLEPCELSVVIATAVALLPVPFGLDIRTVGSAVNPVPSLKMFILCYKVFKDILRCLVFSL